jgi:hypothetical protein
MKKFVIVAGFALLAACGSKTEAPADATATDSAAAAAATTAAPVAATAPGVYDVVGPDGTKMTSSLIKDGTYVDRDAAGKVVEKGTWADKDGKTCFTTDKSVETCYTLSAMAADGSFTATDAKGAVTKVAPHTKM